MLALCEEQDILQPQAAYGYWKAAGQGNDLILFDAGRRDRSGALRPAAPAEGGRRVHRRLLPRRGRRRARRDRPAGRDRGAAGLRRRARSGSRTTATRIISICTACRWRWPRRWRNTSTSASAPNSASPPRTTATWRRCCSRAIAVSRYSFGYPACPKLEDQAPLLALLGAERIGVALSDEFQLHPEQSTSAIVVLNPQAKYFSV